jgi:uncharacterized protein YaiL (DUF2058 family)
MPAPNETPEPITATAFDVRISSAALSSKSLLGCFTAISVLMMLALAANYYIICANVIVTIEEQQASAVGILTQEGEFHEIIPAWI